MNKIIDSFLGDNYYLSNYFPCLVPYKGLIYRNSEAAFHAQKCPILAKQFVDLSPGEAKRLGRNVPLRGDWEAVKDQIMYEILQAKFNNNPDLKQKLIMTGDAELIEGNGWHDMYWGVYNGVGQNRLGELLMKLRKSYQ